LIVLAAALFIAGAAVAIDAEPKPEPPRAGIKVERGEGAESCADAGEIAERARARMGLSLLDSTAAETRATWFDVAFTRSGDSFRAELRAHGEIEGVRTIEDASPTCTSLADAIALALSLLVHPSSRGVAPVADVPTAEVAPAAAVAESHARYAIEATGGVMTGVVGPYSPAFIAGVARRAELFALELDVLALWPDTADVRGGGTVRETFLGGKALACLSFFGGLDDFALDGCLGATVGRLAASASGLDSNGSAARPWIAGGTAVTARGPIIGVLGWKARVGVDVPLAKEGFSIVNVPGEVYIPPRITVHAAIGVTWSIE
jgi:hypothetical protein